MITGLLVGGTIVIVIGFIVMLIGIILLSETCFITGALIDIMSAIYIIIVVLIEVMKCSNI